MTTYYLDSSVAVRILLGHSPSSASWFDRTTADRRASVVASRLLRTELTRVLRREGLPVSRRETVLDHVGIIPLDDGVLAQAEAIVPHVKTLDAIHLASLVHTGLDAVVVTHDAAMRATATVIGYHVFDPVEDEAGTA